MAMEHGNRPVTMQAVAEAAGVSPMTVSNAFRHPARVLDETRLRVLKVAAALGYVPNHVAGNLASGTSRVIGAVIPSIKNSSFYKYVHGMQQAAGERGYQLVLKLADSLPQETAAIETFLGLRVAGIVLVGDEHEAEPLDLIAKTGVPVVEAWVDANPFDMAVGYSTVAATEAMVDLLVDAGHRRIGFVGYAGAVSHRFTERLPAFRRRLSERGLAGDLVHLADEADGFGAGPKALDALCRIDPELDAMLCPTDILAAGVLLECGRRNWSVPGRIAVAGWGDYEIAAEITPALTTLEPHTYEMGHAAVSAIVDRAAGKSYRGRVIDTGFHIVERASV